MNKILSVYIFPKETVSAKMTLFKNTKVIYRLLDDDKHFFNIFAVVLQGKT